jgi:cephalosporin hydroxylase
MNSPKPEVEQQQRLDTLADQKDIRGMSRDWIELSMKLRYVYNFNWLGRPIIQLPQDTVQLQELIWTVKPDLIIETGIAHGGSLVMSASMLSLLEYCEAAQNTEVVDPSRPKSKVLGVDIDIRAHNRAAIEAHPMVSRIEMIEGSSLDSAIIAQVRERAAAFETVMVFLDSNHVHEHVLAELNAYAPLVSKGSYCVVFDTWVEDMPQGYYTDRPWDKGNNPKTAMWEYLESHPEFEIDKDIDEKLLLTLAPSGYLRRIG